MVAARRELGEELEPEVVNAFLDRVERAVDAQVDARLKESGRRGKQAHAAQNSSLALAIVSLGTAIPLTAIAAEFGGLGGMIAAWAGIVGVNFAQSRSRQ